MSEHDKSMSNVCPVCQHDNSVDANFCSRCGHRLGVPAEVGGDATGVIPMIGDEVQIGKFRMIFHTGGHGRL